MPQFSYIVKDTNGKTMSGVDEAPDILGLATRLQQQGHFVVNITPLDKNAPSTLPTRVNFTHNRVSLDDLLVFCRQLGVMLSSGVTLYRALDIISMQVDSRKLGDAIAQIKKDIQSGNSLSASLARHPKIFSQFWVSLTEVGEASGTMPVVLEKLALHLEQQAAFNNAIISAIIYPIILCFVATGAVFFFALFIGPRFKALFENFNAKLPPLTLALLTIFDFIKTQFLSIFIILGVIILLVRLYVESNKGRETIEKIIFSLPTFGVICKTIVVERFTSQMAILVESGVPILYSLDITQRMVGSRTCEIIINQVKESVREGKMLAEPMAKSGFFPPIATQMIMVGEETGQLSKMLKSVADYYQIYVQTFLKRFGIIFEPFMIVVIGVMVGTIVIAMFMPILNLSTIGGGGIR